MSHNLDNDLNSRTEGARHVSVEEQTIRLIRELHSVDEVERLKSMVVDGHPLIISTGDDSSAWSNILDRKEQYSELLRFDVIDNYTNISCVKLSHAAMRLFFLNNKYKKYVKPVSSQQNNNVEIAKPGKDSLFARIGLRQNTIKIMFLVLGAIFLFGLHLHCDYIETLKRIDVRDQIEFSTASKLLFPSFLIATSAGGLCCLIKSFLSDASLLKLIDCVKVSQIKFANDFYDMCFQIFAYIVVINMMILIAVAFLYSKIVILSIAEILFQMSFVLYAILLLLIIVSAIKKQRSVYLEAAASIFFSVGLMFALVSSMFIN